MAILLAVRRRCCSGSARRRPTRTASRPRTSRCCSSTGLPLLYAGLLTAADVLGADVDPLAGGALMWTSAVAGALALWPAFERNSAISLLLAAILGGVALLSALVAGCSARSRARRTAG